MPSSIALPPSVPGARRAASDATRAELVARATELFGDLGYAATSLDAVAAAAGVTKGALYHHFQGKKDLFEVVFDLTAQRMLTDVRAQATRSSEDARISEAVRLFLTAHCEPRYRQIVLHDGPGVLGSVVRDPAKSPTFPVIAAYMRRVMPEWHEDDATLDMMAKFFFSACEQAAHSVAEAPSEETEAALERAERSLRVLLAALRQLSRNNLDAASALAAPYINS
ncbi:TetR/AcrR family transcriptional regulator [Nocardioides yefusunii]|uniref:TetR/AcrR family transcriptional regulator n=1 Tax=Nocardioides yefusunii TaxID=2500546 RepID=A0ABW1QVS2_9ACTN|nr:TetR/AcrR family transcriptional regulator [Nocardioides yefusunii]